MSLLSSSKSGRSSAAFDGRETKIQVRESKNLCVFLSGSSTQRMPVSSALDDFKLCSRGQRVRSSRVTDNLEKEAAEEADEESDDEDAKLKEMAEDADSEDDKEATETDKGTRSSSGLYMAPTALSDLNISELADGRPHARLGKPTAVMVESPTVHRRIDLLDREAVYTSNVCRPVAAGLSFPRTRYNVLVHPVTAFAARPLTLILSYSLTRSSTGPMIAHRRKRAYAAAVVPWALPPAPADSSGLQDPSSASRPPRQRRSPAVSNIAMRAPVPWKMAWLL
ncbi:hypothetical protein B484DRAFT_473697, partial [Ochromonadaceae sp. CCMP2298]